MISFYPGPSKIHDSIGAFLQEAVDSGILSANHRSPTFMELAKSTVYLLKDRLNIPKDYEVFFTSSATECWEIIAQSYISEFSFHIYNGAFGEKWMKYRQKISNNASGYAFSPHRMLSLNSLKVPTQTGLICLTHNETSNGTQLSQTTIRKIKNRNPNSLICVDATSSMAGAELKWRVADIWYASVQKCFGLPAGMGVMICSPKAINKAIYLSHNQHYNSIKFIYENMQKWQTTHTPNVLNIFLMNRVIASSENISKTSRRLKLRKEILWQALEKNGIKPLIGTNRLRSDTVLAIKGSPDWVKKTKEEAKKAGLVLGNGYGAWKENCFRIANFPAITDKEIDLLTAFLLKTNH